MVIREILKKGDNLLKKKGIEDSYNESAVLFACAADKSRTYIYTHMDDEVGEKTLNIFNGYIEKRSQKMPVAYITGSAWFMSMEFFVNESTLIPRPETEGLVEEVIKIAGESDKDRIAVLDMCTGSGCIGISVAEYVKNAVVTLADINQNCIDIAEKNIMKHDLSERAATVRSDLYKSIRNTKYDIITINPPYIPADDILNLEDDVRIYEPMTALDGGKDGLDFYRRIATETKKYLKENGCLIIEIGIGQSESVTELLLENNYFNFTVRKDLSGIPRIIKANI